jgi:hypothetical protein
MTTLQQFREETKRLCDALPEGKLAVDYDKRVEGADQIVLEGTASTVAFMSTGWNPDDSDDPTNPYSEFFAASRLSLPKALRIIEAIYDDFSKREDGGEEDGKQIIWVAERILNEPPAERKK